MAVGRKELGREQPFSGKLFKKRLRILQIGGFEAFGEPAVQRRQQVMGAPPLAPIGPEPGKIAGGAKLEDARRSLTGGGQRGVESGLGSPSVTAVAAEQARARSRCSSAVRQKCSPVASARAKPSLIAACASSSRPSRQLGIGEQHQEIGVQVHRAHGRAPVEEIPHVLGGTVILLLVDGAPRGQDARFGVVYGEAVLVGEPREPDGAAVELFKFASELQQQRAPREGVRDHLRLPERQRVRDTLRVGSQRPLRMTQKKQSIAALGEAALPASWPPRSAPAFHGGRSRRGEHMVHVVAGRFQITAEQTRCGQRMARLHLMIDIALGFGLRQESVAAATAE